VVPDNVAGRDVGQHRNAQAAPTVLMHGDNRSGGGPAFGHHVEHKFDGRADDDGAGEHGVR
jgi:hypothetical protein